MDVAICLLPPIRSAPTPRRPVARFCVGALCGVLGASCLAAAAHSALIVWVEQPPAMLPHRAPTLLSKSSTNLGRRAATHAVTLGLLGLGAGGGVPAYGMEAAFDPVPDPPAMEAVAETRPAVDTPGPATALPAPPVADQLPPKQTYADFIRSRLPQPRFDATPTNPENLRPAGPLVLYLTAPVILLGLGAILTVTAEFQSEQQAAEAAWRSSDRSSLYYRIGGDALIQPAVWVFEDETLASPTARRVFDGLPRDETRALQVAFVMATIGGPHDPTAIKDLFAKKMCDDPEYDALVACLTRALLSMDVPPDLVKETAVVAESKRNELLGLPPGSP